MEKLSHSLPISFMLDNFLNSENSDEHFKNKSDVSIIRKLNEREKFYLTQKVKTNHIAYRGIMETFKRCENVTFGLIEHTDALVAMLNEKEKIELFPDIYPEHHKILF